MELDPTAAALVEQYQLHQFHSVAYQQYLGLAIFVTLASLALMVIFVTVLWLNRVAIKRWFRNWLLED